MANLPSQKTANATMASVESHHRAAMARLAAATELAAGAKWRDQAACRTVTDPEIFFEYRRGDDTVEALAYCDICPLATKTACGNYADQTFAQGVWGGTYRTVRS